MKHFLRLCLLLLCLSSCKQKTFFSKVTVWPGDKNVESLDRNNGFKDLKLNRHISALIKYLDKSNPSNAAGYTIYQVKADSLAKFNIDEIKIKSIKTHFLNNLLFRFEVELEGENNAFPFYLLLIDAYGGAYPENTSLETYKWIGNNVSLKYTVEPNRNATAEFTSIILAKAMGAG